MDTKAAAQPVNKSDTNVMHDFSGSEQASILSMKHILVFLIIILLGIGTGYMFAGSSSKESIDGKTGSNMTVSKGKIFGSDDIKTFKDIAEGELAVGGIEGEGQFHLVRPGGDSQNVYLTSATVDLSVLKGKKIKVWGQTLAAQRAGWLMEVGRVEVLE